MTRSLIVSLFTLPVSAAFHWPIASWALATFPRLRERQRWVWGLTALLVVATPVARILSSTLHGGKSQQLAAASMIELTTVGLALIPLLLMRTISRWYSRREPPLEEPVDPPKEMTRRQVIEGVSGAAILAGSGSALGWGMLRGRHEFVIREVPVKIPGLPPALDGYTIAQISDIHTGVFVGERELREGLERVAQTKADLVVATGDLIDHDDHFIPLLARTLASIRARDGVVGILGNHDYYTGANEVLAGLHAAGIRTLVNDGMVMRPRDGGGFALLGVADLQARRAGYPGPSLERAIATVPEHLPRILLAHQPPYFDDVKGRVALQLSGHTHGGQINPGIRPGALFMRYLAGRYEDGGSTLWVNSGFGTSGPPTRVGTPPEVTKIILVAS
jgi:predicted MPP superfamily phosphohydrolase